MRKLFLVLSLASALVALGAGLDGARAQAPKEWKIGALFAFSGPLAFLGQETFRGAEIASQIINEAGGINGAPIVWVKADAGSPAQARSEAERLAGAGIAVVFGTNQRACHSREPSAGTAKGDLLGTWLCGRRNYDPGI